MTLKNISAVTLAVRDMRRAIAFYQKLGFELFYGDSISGFSSLRAGDAIVNLAATSGYEGGSWGRVVFRVEDVDGLCRALKAAGLNPEELPRDAPWGERFFYLIDLDGHELSFAEVARQPDSPR